MDFKVFGRETNPQSECYEDLIIQNRKSLPQGALDTVLLRVSSF